MIGTGISLATLGTAATALITGLAAHWLLDIDLLAGLLLGSIAATTDTAAVFSVLRGSGLRRRLARTLEAESGFNDPVAILLVLGFIDWIKTPGYGLSTWSAWWRASCRWARRWACWWAGSRSRPSAAPGSPPRASTRSPRWPPPRWPSARPTSWAAPASWPSTSSA